MRWVNIISGVLLAIPLVVFGGNYFLGFFELPKGDGLQGDQLLGLMYDGGFMAWVAAGHVLLGVLLLVPRTRFAAGIVHLPVTIGIVGFHASMLPAGVPIAIVLLCLNIAVIAEPRIRSLFALSSVPRPMT